MKQIVQKGIFIFLLFMKMNCVLSQQFYAKPITINTGLPSNSIYSILEDNQRYIWFTSDEGLIRYDGIHFQIFKSDQQSSFSGSGIMKDKWGRIWYQNFDGISYYVENNKLNELKKEGKTSYLPQQFTDKHLFTIGEKAFIIYDLKTLKRIKKIAISKMEIFTSLTYKGEYYFVMNDQLFKITKELKLKKYLDLPLNNRDFPILFSSDKKLFFLKKNAQESSIWEIINNDLVLKTILPKNTIIQNCRLLDSTFYVATTNGIYTYSSNTGKSINHHLTGKNISDVIIDSKKNYWFSSTLDGLLIVPDLDIIQYNFTDFSPLRIIPYEKDILISTKKGEIRAFNEKNQTNKVIYNSTPNSEIYYTYLNNKKNEFHYVSSDGLTYFNTINEKNSCTKFNFAIKQIIQIDEKYSAFAATGSSGFYVHKKDLKTISKFDKYITQLVKREEGDYIFYNIGLSLRGKSILFDAISETVYIATNTGLFSWKKGILKEITNKNKPFYFSKLIKWDNVILAVGPKGIIETFTPLTKKQKKRLKDLLQIENINQIKIYDNRLMIRTRSRICVFRKNKSTITKQVTYFDLTNRECLDFTFVNNSIWLVLSDGLIKWNLNQGSKKSKNGIFSVKQLKVNNRIVPLKTKKSFSYKQNNIQIEFALLDYGIKTIESVYYQINDSKWQIIDPAIRALNFPSLNYGDYTIKFKGEIKGEIVDFEELKFTIEDPFWATTWFLGLMVLSGLILSSIYFRYQIRMIRIKNSLINDKIKLESNLSKSLLTSIKSQMNPHFIFNALNTIQAYIYLNDKKNAGSYLTKFSKLTRSILDMSEKEKISLKDEITALKLYLDLEKMRFQGDFEYDIIAKNISKESIFIPSMLIQPYVENAVKHGLLHSTEFKKLVVEFTLDDNYLVIEIDDNGVGRKRSEEINLKRFDQHESFSSKANEKRLELLNSISEIGVQFEDKLDDDNRSLGTKVILKIRINNGEN